MPRGRKPNLVPSTRLELALPTDIRSRLDLHLFSEVEGRIPQGAYTTFFEQRLREFFKSIDQGVKS